VVQREADAPPFIAATLWDQHDNKERTPRLFDLAGFLALRLILLPKALIRIDHTDRPPGPELHYVTIYDHIIFHRVLGDAQPGFVVEQRKDAKGRVLNHYDLRLGNLIRRKREEIRHDGKPMGMTHQGRKLALDRALARLTKNRGSLPHPLTDSFFEGLFDEMFDLLDDMHGHEVG
jgi:hypothetical protein